MLKIGGFEVAYTGIDGIVYILFFVNDLKPVTALQPEEVYGPCVNVREVVCHLVIYVLGYDRFGKRAGYDSGGFPFYDGHRFLLLVCLYGICKTDHYIIHTIGLIDKTFRSLQGVFAA